jgi:hypothetical protein
MSTVCKEIRQEILDLTISGKIYVDFRGYKCPMRELRQFLEYMNRGPEIRRLQLRFHEQHKVLLNSSLDSAPKDGGKERYSFHASSPIGGWSTFELRRCPCNRGRATFQIQLRSTDEVVISSLGELVPEQADIIRTLLQNYLRARTGQLLDGLDLLRITEALQNLAHSIIWMVQVDEADFKRSCGYEELCESVKYPYVVARGTVPNGSIDRVEQTVKRLRLGREENVSDPVNDCGSKTDCR